MTLASPSLLKDYRECLLPLSLVDKFYLTFFFFWKFIVVVISLTRFLRLQNVCCGHRAMEGVVLHAEIVSQVRLGPPERDTRGYKLAEEMAVCHWWRVIWGYRSTVFPMKQAA